MFWRSIHQLFSFFNRRDKKIVMLLVLMSVGMSILEVLTISMIMPFITLASNPTLILEHPYSKIIYEGLHFKSPLYFMYAFSFSLVGLYFFRMGYGVLFTYLNSRFSNKKAHMIAQQLFLRHIQASYLEHTNLHLDRIRNTIITKSNQTMDGFGALWNLLSETMIIMFLYVLLLLTNWKMTLVLSILLLLQIFFITKHMSKTIQKKGRVVTTMSEKSLKVLSKFFGNFKLTRLKNSHLEACKRFSEYSLKNARAKIAYQTMQVMPNKILETIGFSLLILAVAYVLYKYGEAKMVLPIISMYALALYRMLPSISRILGNYNIITFHQHAINIVYKDFHKPIQDEGDAPLNFTHDIQLRHLNFAYKFRYPVLQNFNLTIYKGQKVAFIGPSGCGKSTLVDIIMGMLTPSNGEIRIDGNLLSFENIKSWRQKFGYIPQNIYLFDGNIAENIAFGSPLDEQRLIEVCKMAHIYDFLTQHEGIYTQVGEGGVKLSGGQKQRIGIARALYDDPEILVLDEATSALDTFTESKIMDEIYNVAQNRTLLVIAHRLSTIERCDVVIDLQKMQHNPAS
ncbi:ATP-binding cassette domain-containing protein [Helicobacter baculiformis]|uniref:ATP-binding cassette domain-containing protein n=1 Tax=Helicobacter baculiformis TaxID=427351 RepID=A0ABV7ZHK8_9HELI|nr:ABC transporter ATP-binding protein [Helicobacter baculiformis]